MPACQSARSSSASDRGQPVCSTTTTRSSSAGEPGGGGLRAGRGGPSARRPGPAPAGRASTSSAGQRAVERAHRADAPEAGRRHLPVDAARSPRPPSRSAGARRRWRRGGRRPRPGGRARASRRSSGGRSRRRRSPASRRSTRPTRPGRSATSKRRAIPVDVAHAELHADPRGTGTSRCGPGPRGARGRRRRGSGASVIGPPRRTDRLAQRVVEPVGDAGPAEGDAAAGRGWLRRPNQPGAGHQLGAGERRRRPGCTAGGRRARRPARVAGVGALDADREGRDPVAGGAAGPPGRAAPTAWARLRPPAVVASVRVTSRTGGRRAAAWSATARAQPASAWIRSTMPACSASTRSHAGDRRRPAAAPARATTTASSGPAARRPTPRASAAPAKPARRRRPRRRARRRRGPRARRRRAAAELRAVGDDRARARPRPARRRRRRLVEDRRRTAGCSPPLLAWLGLGRRQRTGGDGLEHVRPARRRRRCAPPRAAGAASITATSDPPAKSTWPRAPGEVRRPRGGRRAARAPRASGIDPSESPPVADEPAPAPARRAAAERGGDHPGDGDRRHGVDDDARRRAAGRAAT